MSKRFTDTELWVKPWFGELSPAEKSAWFYITAHCDNVGVWTPNTKLAEFVIGESIDWMGFAAKCNGNIDLLDDGKWWLVDFVDFQYGNLRGEVKDKARLSYVRILQNRGLWERYNQGAWKGLGRGFYAHKEKEKEKEKDKKGEVVDNMCTTFPDLPMNQSRYSRLVDEYGEKAVTDYIEKIRLWEASKGESTKDYAARAEQWMKRDNIAKVHKPKLCPDCGKQYIGDCCGRCGFEEGKA